jgi:integrase
MARLGREPGTVAKALAFIVLTAARSGEALGMTWDEVDLATATWTIPASRVKAGKAHVVPLSDQAISILRGQYETRGKNPHVFPSHLPRRALSSASLSLVMQRLGANATTHGMRASFRMWAADTGVPFEVAEACLAHSVGNQVVAAYQRSSMLERRRPVMDAWASYVMPTAKVISIRKR